VTVFGPKGRHNVSYFRNLDQKVIWPLTFDNNLDDHEGGSVTDLLWFHDVLFIGFDMRRGEKHTFGAVSC
jgi:hypothetical protein